MRRPLGSDPEPREARPARPRKYGAKSFGHFDEWSSACTDECRAPVGKEKVVAHHFRKMAPEVEQAWEVIKASKDPAHCLPSPKTFQPDITRRLCSRALPTLAKAPAPGQRRDNAYYVGECDRLAADPRDERNHAALSVSNTAP